MDILDCMVIYAAAVRRSRVCRVSAGFKPSFEFLVKYLVLNRCICFNGFGDRALRIFIHTMDNLGTVTADYLFGSDAERVSGSLVGHNDMVVFVYQHHIIREGVHDLYERGVDERC